MTKKRLFILIRRGKRRRENNGRGGGGLLLFILHRVGFQLEGDRGEVVKLCYSYFHLSFMFYGQCFDRNLTGMNMCVVDSQ